MLAPIAPLVGSILGLFFAWVTRAPNARSSVGIPSRSLLVVILFSLLVFAPVCSYFLAFAPDWSYAYLVDSEHLPSTVDLGLVLLNVTAVPAGFLIGWHQARARSKNAVARLGFVLALGALLFVALTIRRLGVDASYAQYHGDFGTRPLAGSPLGYAILWMNFVLVGATAWTAHCLRRIALHPAELKVWDDYDEVKVQLPPRFAERIDAVAQRLGLTQADAYSAEFRWGEEQERPGSVDEVAASVTKELEAALE